MFFLRRAFVELDGCTSSPRDALCMPAWTCRGDGEVRTRCSMHLNVCRACPATYDWRDCYQVPVLSACQMAHPPSIGPAQSLVQAAWRELSRRSCAWLCTSAKPG